MNNFFDTIVNPYTVDDFFNTYHEKDILHIKRNDEHYYESILTPKEISNYLERQDVFYPSIRIVKNGKEIPNTEYTLKSTPIGHHRKDGIINTDKAFALFNNGATFVVQAGQRYFNNLSHCCLQLSQKFNAPVQANLYITPNKSQGFNPHWDTHDVFVLQISGTKTWHLYGFEKELPTKNQTFVSKDYNKEPVQTIQLSPGDFLYVPRGYVHDAMADDGISSHITIGILSFTWARYFNEIFPQLEEFKTFREAVPFWKGDISDLIKEKTEVLKQKLSELNFDKGIERLNKNHKTAQAQPLHNYFESIRNIDKVTSETKLRLNEGVIYTFVKKNRQTNCNY
ncbi:cupin domain-containing protein [Niabella ginsengisoli]|uniref:Cupin domain-containing protein n=1 Tax=Niabella ginsengisoli TaxID=522298 RepID=A0ABS9SLU6_9BACT|nr:cupin domain-containing protein [Niabella ginsengisoli]MCH5599347.1 cupin domain-containing protein [Niabella ginsengisoli]